MIEHTDDYSTVTVKTIEHLSQGSRNVTLFYSALSNDVTLLGVLYHSDKIIIDQELVDDLQQLVNLQKED